MDIDDLITPALVIDKATLLRNIQMMSEKVQRSNVTLRPHIKTHKCFEIANLQTEYGAAGITVSTLGEASVFIRNGFTNVTLAYPVIPDKFPALMKLAQTAEINVVTDHSAVIPLLEAQCIATETQLNVLLKIDCGFHRCGVDPKNPKALSLAKQIAEAPHLQFKGILTHAGHAYNASSKENLRTIAQAEQDIMIKFSEKLQKNGLMCDVVSIGSTPTAMLSPKFKEGITEVRPGNYVFFDFSQVSLGSCYLSDCALSVLTSVVSVQDSHVVVDAGATALSKDAGPTHITSSRGYGVVLDPDDSVSPADAQILSLSQEHGKIQIAKKSHHQSLSPGDHLRIIPNHSCLTANLFDKYYIIDEKRVIATWPIHRDRLGSQPIGSSS